MRKVAPPAAADKAEAAAPAGDNFGLDNSRIGLRPETYSMNGQDVSQAQAFGSLEGPKALGLPDDGHLMRLTIIGPASTRQQVHQDLQQGELAQAAASLVVQEYEPDNWAVSRVGFDTKGSPRIVLQRPDGVVVHSQANYAGGASSLLGAIRKVNPLYSPLKDPNLALRGRGNEYVGYGVGGLALALFVAWLRGSFRSPPPPRGP